jgi:hypothetical protein
MPQPVDVYNDTSDVLQHGTTNLASTSTVSKVVDVPHALPKKGVQLKANPDNGGVVYIGTIGVGRTKTSVGCGFPLEAGDAIFLPVKDPETIYANNATANDFIHWLIV